MSSSKLSESSYRQDYVLNSYMNPIQNGRNHLTPISPNIYRLDYQQRQFDAEHIMSSSPKQHDSMYKVTPHPMNMGQETSNKKEHLNFDSDNKENIQSNFLLFEPLEYEKLFEKKINFSHMGLSSSKKSQRSISELSNESKKFIQRSIQQNIMINSLKSQKSCSSSGKAVSSQGSSPLAEQILHIKQKKGLMQDIPVIESNETIPTKQILQMNFPQSSGQQTNTYSTGKLNLESIEQAQKLENEKQFEEVPSFNQQQEVIDYFLTEEDDPNEHNDSEQGIQLLSELKSELNSIINGSGQNSRISSNNMSKHARTMQEIRSFGTGSNQQSAPSKRCTNACQQLASKIEELKANILNLRTQMSFSAHQNQNIDIMSSNNIQTIKRKLSQKKEPKSVKKQPQIYFQTDKMKKKSKKLIYPDSQIIFSRNDGQFVDFKDQFSKILNQSCDQNTSNDQYENSDIHSQESPVILSVKNSLQPSSNKKTILSSQNKSDYQSEIKNYENGSQSQIQISKKTSPAKFQIEKQAFKMSYPDYNGLYNGQEQFSQIDESEKGHLGSSNISSNSNETLMLEELNMKFNSKLNQLLQFNKFT